MAIVSKTNRDGIDIVIESLQQKFYAQLLGLWDGAATYQMYPRANKNYKENQLIPEVSLDERDYSEVLTDDKYSVTSFFLNNDERIFQDEFKRIKQSISIVFQANLVELYGLTERADELFNMDVLRVIRKENFYIFGDIQMVEGIENVYSELTITGELRENINLTDMSEYHVLRVNFDVIYKPNCNITLTPVCAGVSVSVNGVFSEVIPSGGSYNCVTGGSASIDIDINGVLAYNNQSTDVDIPVVDADNNIKGTWDSINNRYVIGTSEINVNGDFFENLAPETNLNIPILDSDNNPVGTNTGVQIEIGDATQTMNGSAIASQLPETAKTFVIRYENNSPVVVTTVTDTPTSFIGEVPNPIEQYPSSKIYKTGQTTSYAANDDGDLERGNGVNFTTLNKNNYFGNTNRFTDVLGGQTYANDWVIDWSTWDKEVGQFLMWYRVKQTPVNWTTAMVGQPYNLGGFSDCYIPNINELRSLYNNELTSAMNYAPINITASGGSASNLWSSTTVPTATTLALAFNDVVIEQARSKTLTVSYIVLRIGNISEL